MENIESYKDLKVYKLSYEAAMDIYNATKEFPKEEKYSLIDQIRRSSRSVCTSIAEAWRKRRYQKHFISKLSDADAENSETQVWIDFSYDCEYIPKTVYEHWKKDSEEIGKMIAGMINKADKFCNKSFIFCLLSAFCILFSVSVCYSVGSTGATFLKISPGAKPVGMGGTYTAISGDVNSLHYNPAGIGTVSGVQIAAMHTEWVSDINYNFAAGAFKTRNGIFGVSAKLLTMGDMEGRDENREKTESFGAYDFSMQLTYAKSLNRKNLLGGSVKFIRQVIDDETAHGMALDIGFQKMLTGRLNLGAAVRNLGPEMKFISERYNLPLTFVIGAGFTVGGITVAFDTDYEIIDENIKFSLGTEYVPFQFLSLRGGYCFNTLRNTVSSGNSDVFEIKDGLGGGLGINILNYSIDYAVVPYIDLGTTQRISFQVSF